ncbi:MAG: hypothetical protein PWQ70_390 [Clostridiales bacterium]|jgi:hypothetical protein|nr:hypothetical protein [Clostridiales bacterium]
MIRSLKNFINNKKKAGVHMITNIINAGFGHSVRFIAMLESLRTFSHAPITCLTPGSMIKFIKANTTQYNCDVHNFYYLQSLVSKRKKSTKSLIKASDKKLLQKLNTTTIMINDFFVNAQKIQRLFSNNTITCCLYHGNIEIKKNDDLKTAAFKKMVRDTASKHDIFFHINIQQPQYKPNLKCIYIPIPIVSRRISMHKQTVNSILGLQPEEKFILVHAGSAVMENVYKDLHNFYTAVNTLKTSFKIVVASSLENNHFPFDSRIIKAPLFHNGIDLVNASELVISKPGMGILQDCIVTNKPLLFLPGDFAERNLKIQLLDQLLQGNLPMIKNISASNLEESINQCLSIKNLYQAAYEQVPVNGADILARAANILKDIKKDKIQDFIPMIKEMSPFV